MKLFDPRAELAKIQNQAEAPATSATSATQTPENASHVAKVASVAAPKSEILNFAPRSQSSIPSDCRHGVALGGRPKTWTGKIVSLDDWRTLTEWEKHGPNGRQWNGVTKQWEVSE
ncbi:hypothetical protein ACOTTU_01055 [Roseobacter sp. EG26]|uniref:hypothetical protein n=1 Tax=Roseobacter sp. EG26 TaxID=3412477 RepID=UPI003CE50829